MKDKNSRADRLNIKAFTQKWEQLNKTSFCYSE